MWNFVSRDIFILFASISSIEAYISTYARIIRCTTDKLASNVAMPADVLTIFSLFGFGKKLKVFIVYTARNLTFESLNVYAAYLFRCYQ